MRNTWCSSNDRANSSLRAFASARSVPKGFSTTIVVFAGRPASANACRGPEQHVRQCQVHRDRRGGSLERGTQVLSRGDVGSAVRQALDQGVGGLVVAVGEVGVELGPCMAAVGVVVSLVDVFKDVAGRVVLFSTLDSSVGVRKG